MTTESSTAATLGPALMALRSIAADRDDGVISDSDWLDLSRLAGSWPGLPSMQNLVAASVTDSSPRWHLECLRALLEEERHPTDAARLRRRYHARCLGHLLVPADTDSNPLVTILIPVYNRADLLVEAVESCLRQTWRPLEILVVDDGSTDDIAGALQSFGALVRVHRKPHGGVSSARNVGIELARGDFVHFLDSDDLLLPEAVAQKVGAFLRVPDATLCYSHAEDRSLTRPPKPTQDLAVHDLLTAVCLHHPFLIPAVMMPRWSMLEAPRFEEDLQRGEDSRYWFSLGLLGTKVIALTDKLTIRRKLGPSLNDLRFKSEEETLTVRVRDLCDILASPPHWDYAPAYYRRLIRTAQRYAPYEIVTGSAARALSRLRTELTQLAEGRRSGGLSPLPLFAALWADDHQMGQGARSQRFGDDLDSLFAAVPALIDQGLGASAPLETPDIEYWSSGSSARKLKSHADHAFDLLRVRKSHGHAAIAWILRNIRLPLRRRDAKRFRRLRRWTGSSRLAAWLVWGLRLSSLLAGYWA